VVAVDCRVSAAFISHLHGELVWYSSRKANHKEVLAPRSSLEYDLYTQVTSGCNLEYKKAYLALKAIIFVRPFPD